MAAEADGLLRRAGVPMGVAHNIEGRGIIAFERGELNEASNVCLRIRCVLRFPPSAARSPGTIGASEYRSAGQNVLSCSYAIAQVEKGEH